MLIPVSGLVLAILVSAAFSAAELAIFLPSEGRVRGLADQKVRGAAALLQLRTRTDRTLVMLRLLDALADVSAGALTAYIAFLHWDTAGIAAAVGVAALLVLYFGELAPMGLASRHGLRLALVIAPALVFLTRVLSPLLILLARLSGMRSDRRETTAAITETEIRQLASLGHTEGQIEEHERELIERAFRLDETKTWDIMTPRVDIFAWSADSRLSDIAPELEMVRHTRVPVYGDSIDDITGVLYLRDVYHALVTGRHEVTLDTLAREPLVVPGSLPLSKLLRDFQARRIHLAIVVDEYGGTDGLVTLEDVLEELVGEIEDEMDVAEEALVEVSPDEIITWGDTDLRDINQFFDASLPLVEHRSLNGYLLEELGRVPEPGEQVEREGIRIEVLEATETQVTRARLLRLTAERNAADGAAPAGDADGESEVSSDTAPVMADEHR